MSAESPSPSSAERIGIIGARQLVAVQTIDIARLTAHPVGLIPETFIAVTGRGPTDSNESGKTSFLSAVALLLGDPEWRVAGTGAASVEALLFEPITAGATLEVNAATEGYIVGVFADPDAAEITSYTVWMRISSGRPHIQVRHSAGVHLARGMTNDELGRAAPAVYRALGGEPLGSGEYAHVLYGRSPRVLAYVASRGRVRSRASLLKLDAGTFAPERIGDALIALTGRAGLFDRDQQDRRDLAVKEADLAEHDRRDAEHTAREDRILTQVQARNELREQLDTAAELWSKHRARAVLDTYARAESAADLLARTGPARAELVAELERHESQRDELSDLDALKQTVRDAEEEEAEADRAHQAAIRVEGSLETTLADLEKQLNAARIAAAGHDLSLDGTREACVLARDAVDVELKDVDRLHDAKEQEVDRLEGSLQQALTGEFGFAGQVVRILAQAKISSVCLAEVTRLAPETRALWEARLSPWRETVCVARQHLDDALDALSDLPGALLVSAEDALSRTVRDLTLGHPRSLPPGVLEAPAEAVDFLWRLSRQPAGDKPAPHAVNDHGVVIVGGFELPIMGGEDLRTAIADQLSSARHDLELLAQRKQGIEAKHARAESTVVRADNAERAAALQPEVDTKSRELTTQRSEVLPKLAAELTIKRAAHQRAELRVRERDQTLLKLDADVRAATSRLRSTDAEIDRLREASQPDGNILAAWGLGRSAALNKLSWPLHLKAESADRVLDQAPLPPIDKADPTAERRQVASLAATARAQLEGAIGALRHHAEGMGGPAAHLKREAARYSSAHTAGEEDPGGTLFEVVMDSLRGWLDEELDRDAGAPDQAARAQAGRADTTEYVRSETRQLRQSLNETQEAIVERTASALAAISRALDILNRDSGGLGAELDYEIIPPVRPDQDWTCRVIPKWRRNPGGPLLAYDNVTNTAQEKLFSIHLVLAALLAAPHPRGRVLILDELGDSLGAEHRQEVLAAIASVAKDHGITILATCQDAIMVEARPFTKEILVFHYPSRSMPLNRPTRMFGTDPNGRRVELTAEALIEGRTLI